MGNNYTVHKVKKDYTFETGEKFMKHTVTVPKGTRLTHMTAMGIDTNYNFVDDWSWYRPDVTGYARRMMLHDFTYRGVDVPTDFVEKY